MMSCCGSSGRGGLQRGKPRQALGPRLYGDGAPSSALRWSELNTSLLRKLCALVACWRTCGRDNSQQVLQAEQHRSPPPLLRQWAQMWLQMQMQPRLRQEQRLWRQQQQRQQQQQQQQKQQLSEARL